MSKEIDLKLVNWKRGFLEITAEILQVLKEKPLKKSHISSKSKLDSRAVSKYLGKMVETQLVKKSENDSSYFILTKKGTNFLNTYRKLLSLVTTEYNKN